LFKKYTGIMPSKPKGIAHGYLYLSLLSLVKGEIKFLVDVLIWNFMVDGWRYNSVFHGKNGSNSFNSSRSAQQVTCHGLCGVDVDIFCMLTKYLLDRFQFGHISQGS